jgi:Glycosyltransferase family 87
MHSLDRLTRRPSALFGLIGLVALLAIYDAVYLIRWITETGTRSADFYAFWSAGKFLAELTPAEIYDPQKLQAYETALDPNFRDFYPFPYPPPFGLVLRLLGTLSYDSAYLVWIGATLALYLCATLRRRSLSLMGLATLVAPSTLLTAIAGQNGFLTAALMIGGFRLLDVRPLLAGVLLGLLAYKPQLALLIPVVLIAAGRWRSLAAAAMAVATLVAVSMAAFGPAMWAAWLGSIEVNAHLFEINAPALQAHMPTLAPALLAQGLDHRLVGAVQIAVLALIASLLWRKARSVSSQRLAELVPIGTIIATPYAFIYDLPMVTTAVLAIVEERQRTGDALVAREWLIVILTLSLPILALAAILPGFLGPAVLGLALYLAMCPASRDAESGAA